MPKNNKKLFTIIAIVLLTGLAAFIVYYFVVAAPENVRDRECEELISSVQSSSKNDPLYEPPLQYFECIGAY